MFYKALDLHKNGKIEEAIVEYLKLLKKNSDNDQINFLLGNAYLLNKEYKKSKKFLEKAIFFNPKNKLAFNSLGVLEITNHNLYKSVKYFEKSVEIDPTYIEGIKNLANTYKQLNKINESIDAYMLILKSNINDHEANFNLGILCKKNNQLKKSIIFFERASTYKPYLFEIYLNIGEIYKQLGKYNLAIKYFDNAIKVDFSKKYILGEILNLKLQTCDWNNIDNLINKITDLTNRNIFSANPFIFLAITDNPYLQKISSNLYFEKYYDFDLNYHEKSCKKKKLNIGYFSSDFYDHATLHLMMDIFKFHDQNKFEIFLFSYGNNIDDNWSLLLKTYIKNFINIENLDIEKIKDICKDKQLDIAIDLKGYTLGNRHEIFSQRVAPVQINYLGYPGTLSNKQIDYIIADKYLIPRNNEKYYSENVLNMDGCYQPNMENRKISNEKLKKEDFHLPEDKFIYCCFNAHYKINKEIFTSWMRILSETSKSVLWLYCTNEIARKNILEQAAINNIEKKRIIFAENVKIKDHLSRLKLADVFLDTFPYSAHTTASDAIRMNLPLVTLSGESFASRVAGSILSSIGLEELISNNYEEYEEKAINLYNQPHELIRVKTKIENEKKNILFNPKKFTKNLENLYAKICNILSDVN